MAEEDPQYLNQDSSQTFREALTEYYACNPNLIDPKGLEDEVAELFRQHDAGHVIFGCDTSLRGETLIDTWTIFGSTIGLRGYADYLKQPQVNQLFTEIGILRIIATSLRLIPDVVKTVIRSRSLSSKWPWSRYREFYDEPIQELRQRFNIQVL